MQESEASSCGDYIPLDKGWYQPNTRERPKQVRFTILPAQGRTWSSRDILASSVRKKQ